MTTMKESSRQNQREKENRENQENKGSVAQSIVRSSSVLKI